MLNLKDLNPNFLGVALKWLCLFCFVLMLIGIFRACNEKEKSPVQEQITIQAPIVHHYVDDSGHQHGTAATINAPMINTLDSRYQHTIDSLIAIIKAKPSSVQSAILVGTETNGGFVPILSPPVKKDSATELLFYSQNTKVDWHDKFITIHGVLEKDSNWNYKVTDSLSIVTYQKRKGWFSHQLYLDATAQNPNTSIKGITGIEITGYKPRWGIGISVGYGFNGIGFSPIIAVGLQRNFIRF